MKNFFEVKLTFLNVFIFVCLLVLLILSLIPTNYLIMAPGKILDLGDKILINGELRNSGKAFKIVTVSVYEARLVHYLYAKAINNEDVIFNLDSLIFSKKEEKIVQKEMLEESKEKSAIIAYSEATEEFNLMGDGVLVVEVFEEGGSYGKLFEGDLITALDGIEVLNAVDLIRLVRQKIIGDEVNLIVMRNNVKHYINVELFSHVEDEGVPALGVSIMTFEKEKKVEDNIVILIDDILGSSGELMFTLEIYDRLVDDDLLKGYNITGSGIVTDYGKILPIDGIKYKIMAANKADIDYFLCAKDNYDEGIKYVSGKLKLISVETLEDAVNFLSNLS